MKRIFAALALLLATAFPASAGLLTLTYNFTLTGFTDATGLLLPPTDPVFGSVTVTFDPTLTYVNATSGVVLNSLNIPLSSPIAFSFYPTLDPTGVMEFGGASGGVRGQIPGSQDFFLGFKNPLLSPAFLPEATYIDPNAVPGATRPSSIFQTRNGIVALASVSEPFSLSMMAIGVLAISMMWRRRRPT